MVTESILSTKTICLYLLYIAETETCILAEKNAQITVQRKQKITVQSIKLSH